MKITNKKKGGAPEKPEDEKLIGFRVSIPKKYFDALSGEHACQDEARKMLVEKAKEIIAGTQWLERAVDRYGPSSKTQRR